ncbi:hypothetical protein SAMN06273570_2706 [Candidatus Pantoea floridensis]|uniref:Uncharacterized protein n=1 Tax=Candidatus Pantoea floridensis TaxID=1938870 RepID=A0A286BVX2_9GAMM|nr:hypothetical protein BX596_0147 [Enterobacteriaceae bacterium JKS000233]SOD38307.1 hypothetical protein SAMN06273570_2706 [Pantoea floridensis]
MATLRLQSWVFRRVRIHAYRADSGNIQIFVRLH